MEGRSPWLEAEAAAGILFPPGEVARRYANVDESDINPAVVNPKRREALALDALISAASR